MLCALVPAILTLVACRAVAPDAPVTARPLAAYVVLGPQGAAYARAIVSGDACPSLRVDGDDVTMLTRAAPATPSQRPGQGKASAFAVRVCEAPVPPGARTARIDGQRLPLPTALPQRIVVLGDTGCRIKQAEHAYQNCTDAAAWPFAAVAAAAAGEHPDLVVHVGDYHYRESACPADQVCAGSPWGYGWDAWNADLFVPAQPLLAAAPWVVARGNHELCSRAGQGWFRFLDIAPYQAARSCDGPDDDADADFTAPYAVQLGGNWQLILFDSARASRAFDRTRPADARAYARYVADLQTVKALAAAPGMHSIFVSHHPVLGFSVEAGAPPVFGNAALLEPMQAVAGARYFPAGVDLSLHGHVHTFQALDFLSDHPASVVAGHGGDNLDRDMTEAVDETYPIAPDVRVHFVAHASRFGYLVLERAGSSWGLQARALDGTILARCTLDGAHLACPQAAGLSLPQHPPAR